MSTSLRDLPVSGWTIVRMVSDTKGHKSFRVRCLACGATTVLHMWSWAGHGSAHCGSGRHRLPYLWRG